MSFFMKNGAFMCSKITSLKRITRLGLMMLLIILLASSLVYAQDSNQYSGKKVEPKFTTTAIIVDGEPVVFCQDEATARDVLSMLKASYGEGSEQLVSLQFVEDVTIGEAKVPLSRFDGYQSPYELVRYIKQGAEPLDPYIVQEGDTFLDIAEKNGISVEQILKANPNLLQQKYLVVGQEINLTLDKPFINVQTVEVVNYDEEIDFEVIEQPTDRLYEGEYDVKIEGAKGKSSFVAEVVCLNGVEQSRQIISETVIVEPVSRELIVGSKKAPPKKGSGVFTVPARGYIITSPYGYRSFGYHSGIDLAMPTGSDVTAADGGVVVKATWRADFGYHIIIDHGDRKSTLYAHCSELLVQPGDEVFQGQRIALSGSTGCSTGPHLHFEIRIDDVPINPSKFVSF